MDVKDYIASGILEQYVLGDLSSQEVREVECMSHIYPEIEEELSTIQTSIEKMARELAVKPSDEVKKRVFDEIKQVAQLEKDELEKVNVIPFKAKQTLPIWKMGIAASIIGILVLAGYAFVQKQNMESMATVIEMQSNTIDEFANITKESELDAELSKSQLDFITDKATKRIDMAGTPTHQKNFASVYWNKESNKYLLDSKGLPQAAEGKQYQLWAIVDGKPVDMGVFEDCNSGLINLVLDGEVQAFAVTLEPEGGSVSPTMEEMRVVGAV